MPIGNLTSQLFANVYLNEFDRFVRHELKPAGYVRYGDDFVLFAEHDEVGDLGKRSADWLKHTLFLEVHPTNGGVFKVSRGIYFLGHRIYPHSVVADPALIRWMYQQLSPRNVASYQAQKLPKKIRRTIPWILDSLYTSEE